MKMHIWMFIVPLSHCGACSGAPEHPVQPETVSGPEEPESTPKSGQTEGKRDNGLAEAGEPFERTPAQSPVRPVDDGSAKTPKCEDEAVGEDEPFILYCFAVGDDEELYCDESKGDLAELDQLEALVRVAVKGRKPFDASALGASQGLKTLYLENTRLADYTWIESLERLEHVNLSGTEIDHIRFLENSTMLRWLDISKTNVRDLSPLYKMRRLKELYLGETAIDAAELTKLERRRQGIHIYVDFCGQSVSLDETRAACLLTEDTSVMPLTLMKKLRELRVYGEDSGDSIQKVKETLPRARVFHERQSAEAQPKTASSSEPGRDEDEAPTGELGGKTVDPPFPRSKRVIVHRRPGITPSGYRLPGPCVDPVLHAAKSRGFLESVLAREPHSLEHVLFDDLDGDGQKDLIVYADFNVNIETMLYVMRGDCGYWVGEFIGSGAPYRAARTRVNGMADLVFRMTPVHSAPTTLHMYRFDGTKYRLNKDDFRFVPMRSHLGNKGGWI